jgi:glycosyltransferase involved in cell wall biosynthesis
MQDAAPDVAATQQRMGALVERLRPDVVHANQFAAACLAQSVRVPITLTLHSDVLSWRRWTLGVDDVPDEWRAYVALVRQALQRADTVVAVSRFLAEEVRAWYGVARPIEVIHNGWPAPPLPLASKKEALTLLAGRVWDQAKNVQLAAPAAHGWDPGRVVLAGQAAHPETGGRAAVPAPLEPLGWLGRAELDGWLDRARVYLSPARYDPFGLLPLQAALHGCALLLSDIPSYRELWDGAACFFRPDDVLDLRRQWQRVLSDPGPIAERARARALARYSSTRMADAYAALAGRVPA